MHLRQYVLTSLAVVLLTSSDALRAQETDVLFEQTAGERGDAFPSQEFGGEFVAFTSMGADDFVVPTGETWAVSSVRVLGTYSEDGGPAEFLNVAFYADEGGVPGEPVASFEDPPFVDGTGEGDFIIALPSDVLLETGTYWVSVQVDMDVSEGGQWFWVRQATETAIGAEVHWRNPEDGFETGCVDWSPLAGCDAGGGEPIGLDASFRLDGTRTSTGLESAAPGVFEIEAAYPNPFATRSSVAFTVAQTQAVTLTLYDGLGREVRRVFSDVVPGGQRRVVEVDAGGLSAGVYFLRIGGEDFAGMRRLVVVR